MKKILSIIIIIVLSTILGLAYNASTNLSLRLLEATDDVRPFREDFNYNFELVDDIFDDVSLIEFLYLDGVTSAIQTQLDTIDAGAVDTSGTPVGNDIAVFIDLNTIEGLNYAELKAVLDLEIGTDVQAYDAGLLSIAGLTTAANDMIYTTALDTYAIMDTFAELQAIVADKTLVNEEDIFTIDANWVNTANPWADNEVSDTLTCSDLVAGSSVVEDSEVDNDITIDLATLATTFTCTDNESEALACPLVFVDGATGAQGGETDGDITYNPSTGTLTVPVLDLTTALADSEVANNITIDLATLATTFTATDNENEALACPIVFVDGATGAQGAETDDTDFTYNPSTGTLKVTALDLTTVLPDAEVANNITIDLATLATTITITDNENEDLDCPILFVDGGSGTQGAEADGDLHYSPDTGLLTATSFAGNPLQDVTTSSANNTLTVAEAGLILVSDAHTETLPTASGNSGLTYHFIKTDADYDLITLEGDGAETFNYENSTGTPNLTYLRLNTYCAEVTIVSDGTNWQVINEKLGQAPKCSVYRSTDQANTGTSFFGMVDYDVENYDIGSNYDNGDWVSSTATSTSANHLVDSTAPFTSVMVGKYVKNITDTTYTWITAYNSASDVTVQDDIFVNTEAYEIKNAKFTAPVAGYYQVINSLNLGTLIADKFYINYLYKNNTATKIWAVLFHAASTDAVTPNASALIKLAKNDVLFGGFMHNSGTEFVDVKAGNYKTYFMVNLVKKD